MTTIQLTGQDINADDVSCTIEKLLLILKELEAVRDEAGLIWYGADISPVLGLLEPYGTCLPVKIGTLNDLRSLLGGLSVYQIDFGLFVAIAADGVSLSHDMELSAEGPG